MNIKVEPLERSHHRNDFDCGVEELNNFLKRYSFQNQKSHISKTFVAINEKDANQNKSCVLGFYTLSTGQINFDALPSGIKHPRYPVSIARLARLAVDLKLQGQGVGGFLLHDALQKIKTVSQTVGIFAIVVDAKDAEAKLFYQRYGFVPLQDSDLTLCLPTKVLDQLG